MAVTSGHRVLRSTVLLTAGRVAADLIFVGFYLALSRRFGAEGIGQYAFALALTSLVFGVVASGVTDYLVRETSRRRPELPRYLGGVLVVVSLASLAALVLLAALAPLFHLGRNDLLVLGLIALSQLFYYAGTIFRGIFAVYEELSRVAYSEVVYKGIILAIGTVLLVLRMPLPVVLGAFPVAGAGYLLLLIWQSRGYGRPVFAKDPPLYQELRRELPPFFLSALLGTVSFRMNPILLKYFHGYAASGVYAGAYKLVELVLLCLSFYRMALFPALSRLFHQSPPRHQRMLGESLRYLVIMVLPAAAVFFVAADHIILLLFGRDFLPAIPVLRILAVALVFAGVRHLLLTALASMDQQWNWVRTQLLGVALGIAAGFALIPPMVANGAAWAVLLAEAAGCVFAAGLVRRSIGALPLAPLVPPVLASAAMLGAMLLLRQSSIFIQIPAGGAVYLGALIVTGGIDRSTFDLVRGALAPRLEQE